ncbi:MAG: hypothetical protein ABSF99_04120 [Anaerolineales bacterium]
MNKRKNDGDCEFYIQPLGPDLNTLLNRIPESKIVSEQTMLRSFEHYVLMMGLSDPSRTLLVCALPGIITKILIDKALDGARLFQCLGGTCYRLEE